MVRYQYADDTQLLHFYPFPIMWCCEDSISMSGLEVWVRNNWHSSEPKQDWTSLDVMVLWCWEFSISQITLYCPNQNLHNLGVLLMAPIWGIGGSHWKNLSTTTICIVHQLHPFLNWEPYSQSFTPLLLVLWSMLHMGLLLRIWKLQLV